MAHLAPPQRTQGFEKVPSGRSPLSSAHILGGCESHGMACSGFEELIHLNCTLMFIKVLFNLQ